MLVEMGSKLLVVHRRLFLDDASRFFIGSVESYDVGVARVRGHTWVKDPLAGSFYKKEDSRTKFISFSSGALIVYLLPDETDMNKASLELKQNKLFLTDFQGVTMDLTEYEFHQRPSNKGNTLR